jgi:CubicO group peptidase (beta-lactamase class C family)
MSIANRLRFITVAITWSALLASSASTAMAESAKFTDVLRPYVDRHELAGAVTLVTSKDKILSLEAIGFADIADRKPLQTDALFWIASMSKPIAATALMMLVDEGRVQLDDSVEKHLPLFAPQIMAVTPDGTRVVLQKPHHAISIRDLLRHTSGIPAVSSLETPTLDVFPLAVRVQSYALEPLMFEPTAKWSYSNAGINTAARIIEVASGLSYENFLQQRLFGPLGMKDTTFWPTEVQVRRLAKSYKPNAAGTGLEEVAITQLRYPLTDHAKRYAMPAGGLFSTASDLGKFCQMLLNGGSVGGKRYLSAEAIREMTRNQLSGEARQQVARFQSRPSDPDGYGLGWFTGPSGTFGHAGAYSTDMRIDPTHGLATIWLVQHDGFPGEGDKSEDKFNQAVASRFGSAANSTMK